MTERDAIAARFRELSGRYADERANAERSVVDDRWARFISRHDDARPLAAEREGEQRARLARKPPRRGEHDEVGLDAAGRVALVRERYADGDLARETFIRHAEGVIEAGRWEHVWREEPRLLRLVRVELDAGGRPSRALAYHLGDGHERGDWIASERYEYDARGLLVRIEEEGAPAPEPLVPWPDDAPDDAWQGEIVPSYREDGGLTAVDVVRGRASWRAWQRAGDPRNVARLANAAEQALTRRVVEAVAAVPPPEPVAAVALHYSAEAPLPPTLGLLAESERDEIARGEDPDLYLWNPAEWAAELSLAGDAQLDTALAELALEWRDDPRAARALLNAVARRLNEADWPLPLADDFVAFATDYELSDTAANLRDALPAATVRAFGERGWLPPDG